MQEEVKILGVKFDKVTLEEATFLAIKWAKEEHQRHITTPNPEILLKAQKNEKFKEVLNKSSLSIADGTGILLAARYLKKRLPCRVTGIDLMQKICEKSVHENLKIFLLGAKEGVSEKTKEVLEKKYHGLKIVGTHAGSPQEFEERQITELIDKSGAEILFVAYGAPAQELWIHRNLHKMPKVKVAIGIGGAFDFISGSKKRAPKLMRKVGLEWLYRLFQEPSRIKRIYNATIKFPIKVISSSSS